MRLLVLLVSLTLAGAVNVDLMRAGRPIPLHIPTQAVISNDTFDIPYWLGAYYATVEVSSAWTLPLTIGNGGQTYPGEFLIIRNYGPESITLYPQAPETIEGVSSFPILADSVVEILSGYPNWVVTSIPNFSNQNITTNALDVGCSLTVGGPYLDAGNLECGAARIGRIRVGPDMPANTESSSILTAVLDTITPTAGLHVQRNLNTSFPGTSSKTAIASTVSIMANQLSNQETRTFDARILVGDNLIGAVVGGITSRTILGTGANASAVVNYRSYMSSNGPATCPTGNGYYDSGLSGVWNIPTSYTSFEAHSSPSAGSTIGRYRGVYIRGSGFGSSSVTDNIGIEILDRTGAAIRNYGLWFSTASTTKGSGIVWGSAADVSLYRSASGVLQADANFSAQAVYDSATRVVRSCVSGAGITCSVTDGVLTVSANSNLQKAEPGIMPLGTPTSSNSPCTAGTYMSDTAYLYICVATGTWRRIPSESF